MFFPVFYPDSIPEGTAKIIEAFEQLFALLDHHLMIYGKHPGFQSIVCMTTSLILK